MVREYCSKPCLRKVALSFASVMICGALAAQDTYELERARKRAREGYVEDQLKLG